MKKVAIDISQVVYGTGVSIYTKNLLENLLKIDKENQYILFAGTLRRKREILNLFPTSRVFPFPPKLADFVWNKLHVFNVENFVGKVDVFHSSDWTQPPSRAFKVTTIHDLIPLKFPKMLHKQIVEAHKYRLSWVEREVDRIIVPSTSTKNDLLELGIDSKRIRVIYEAASVKIAKKEEVERVRRKFRINGDYLLAVASAFYKNTENVIKAFDLASAGKNLKLVIIGRQSNTQIKQRRRLRLTGFVNGDEYAALMTGAKAFVFPSLYEGFGITILDAFSCKTPVVTSNTSSMPEIAGDAAVLVDPYDIHSIADGIEKVLRGRKGLIDKGLKRVKEFSWKKAAEETLKVYKEVDRR